MFLTEKKLQARIEELSRFRYRDARLIPAWHATVDSEGAVGAAPPESVTGNDVMRIGDRWTGRDLYLWMSASVDVPTEWENRRIVGRFDFGRTGAGNNSGFESLLYLNGVPYQGVDSNHQEVFLPGDTAGQTVQLQFRLWSGLEGGGPPRDQNYTLEIAELTWLDNDSDDLYFTALAMLQTIGILDETRPERIGLINTLDKAMDQLDWSRPGSDAFYASVKRTREQLSTYLEQVDKSHDVTLHCIGHTHIDVAWLWRLRHTREKSVRSFSTVLRLMELYPEYLFLQSQPQLYAYLRDDYPEVYEAIKKRVKQGRWEAGGAMWLEADCNVTSGESLVRQILYGTRFFETEFGVQCSYLWLPDVFGYSWALPQILRKSGIQSFMTTKISWNQYNRMPHDTFMWRGIDGSEVLAHFITTPEPVPHGWFYTYNGQLTATTLHGAWQAYQDKRVNQELLVSYGFGDGGGGVTRDMLEMRRRFDKIPGLPNVVPGRADDFFRRLLNTFQTTDQYVHTWDGELYLEYHRGTYTSQAYNKRMNRKLEIAYRETEWLSVLSSLLEASRVDQVWDSLYQGWQIILRNQFHDIIPGSSIHEVYEDSRVEYAQAQQIAAQVWAKSVQAISSSQHFTGAFTVYNSANWSRKSVVKLPVDASSAEFMDNTGNRLPSQRIDDSWWVYTPEVPSLGYTRIQWRENSSAMEPVIERVPQIQYYGNGLSTPYYELEWNQFGQLTRIYDKRAKREVLSADTRGNILQVFEDKPIGNDAWDIDIFYNQKSREIVDLESVEMRFCGEVCTVVRFRWHYGESTVNQDLVVFVDSPRIDFVTDVDWHERQQLLKVAFPIDVRATEATYDIQFGNVKRSTHWNTSWDQARFETVGHQWVDLSENGYGVALANDCKYGYDVKDNCLRLSLIKSAIYPDYDSDQGEHQFTYSLIPHLANWLSGDVVHLSWDLNSPLRVEEGWPSVPQLSLFEPSIPTVMVDAVKPAEDDERVIVRLHDFSGGRTEVTIFSDFEVMSWQLCDLLERPTGSLQTGPFTFAIQPYEILTFALEIRNYKP